MRALQLSAEEGFVLSRIDGELGLNDLVALCGLEEERVVEIVQRLHAQGAIDIPGQPSARPPRLPPMPPPEPVVMDPLPMAAIDAGEDDDEFREPAPSFAGIDELDFGGEAEAIEAEPSTATVILSICGATHVGVVRTNNEDAFAVINLTSGEVVDVTTRNAFEVGPNGVLLAVSDGMGGQNAGEVASALTLEVIEKHFATSGVGADAGASLSRAVESANVRVTDAASAPGRDGMGATLVAFLVQGTIAYTAEVGDSRAYVLRHRRLTQLSKDQTQIQVLLDQGLMTPEIAKSSHAKNIVLQAVGKTPDIVVAQRRLSLRNGDRLLLCSDGLTGHIDDVELGLILSSLPSLEEACEHLVKTANERGGKDNITVILAEVTLLGDVVRPEGETIEQSIVTTRAFTVGEGTS